MAYPHPSGERRVCTRACGGSSVAPLNAHILMLDGPRRLCTVSRAQPSAPQLRKNRPLDTCKVVVSPPVNAVSAVEGDGEKYDEAYLPHQYAPIHHGTDVSHCIM